MIVDLSITSRSFPSGFFGLGDILAIIYALENLGAQKGLKFRVFFDGIFDPTTPFVLKHVFKSDSQGEDLVKMIAENTKNLLDIDEFKGSFFGGFFISSMLHFMKMKFGYDPYLSLPVETKEKPPASNFVMVQMDGRCSRIQGRDISLRQKRNISLKHKNIRLIGGMDMDFYLGHEFIYEKCEFERMVKLISSASKFIGTDSGVSHLAGFVGTESKIYVLGNIRSLKNYYMESYRNCKVVGFPFL